MRIGLRLLLAFLLVLGLGLVVVLQVFLEEIKPGTRMAMEDSLVDTAYTLAQLAAHSTNLMLLYAEYRRSGVDFTQPLASKPWGMREFGIRTVDGHRLMFGQEL